MGRHCGFWLLEDISRSARLPYVYVIVTTCLSHIVRSHSSLVVFVMAGKPKIDARRRNAHFHSTTKTFTDNLYSDELRRSGRATKGQHTKDQEASEEVNTKPKGRKGKKGKKAVEEEDGGEEDAYIRCLCGSYEEEEETERSMICCDNCSAWQHNDCMGLPDDPSYSPEAYYCEQCRPEDHVKLLAAIARGEKPWEEAARRRDPTSAEVEKKKGKRGRKSAVSRGSPEAEDGTPTRGGQKRKVEETSTPADSKVNTRSDSSPDKSADTEKGSKKARSSETPQNGVHKSSPAHNYSQGTVATSLTELNNGTRKTVASNLIKSFVDHTQNAVKQGAYTLPRGTSTEQNGARLGLLIEHAMYAVHCKGSGEPNEAYKAQMRTILYNMKKNVDLRDRVLLGEISAHRLASMDAKEMASDELQRKDAAMKLELEKQHTIVQEQGPRIRRTHKGDEYVDEADQLAAESTSAHVSAPRPNITTADGDSVKSPNIASPQEKPGDRPVRARPKPSIDTKRKSSANFNIDNVWSTVQGSPDATQQRFPELQVQSPTAREPAGPGTRADADIDALLKDEDAESVVSAPYSPKDFDDADGIVWRGSVNGGNLGRFQSAARYTAGCRVDSLHMTYQDLMPPDIGISGRIDPDKADEYLCGLQYSSTSDVVVVSIIEPQDPTENNQFLKLFSYFKSRGRYGVGTQHQNPAIKDIYLIPLDVGDTVPGLLTLLDAEIPKQVKERVFMVPFVIKNTELQQNAAAMVDGAAELPPTPISQQTPITPHDGMHSTREFPAHHPQAPALPYHQSSLASNMTSTVGSQTQSQHGNVPPLGGEQHPTQQPPVPALLAAQQVLGPELARSPAVLQIISQAPASGVAEMTVVRECIQENPQAAQDLKVLTTMLEHRYDHGPQDEAGGR